ncbi:hypothetical protein tb265_26780 [Gemmatimonadetes bacterium T265]|nr:hypothetical protein tb265_26780 [Gemmatimonadetes bacterium T265]
MESLPLLDAVEPKFMDKLAERADDLAHGDKPSDLVKAAIAVGSVPIMLGALASTAVAQAPQTVIDVLQYALLLENLENQFYLGVTGASGSPFAAAFATVRGKFAAANATILPTLNLLSQHETAHVALLQTVIKVLGATPNTYDPATTFDFTGARKVGGDPNGPFYPATQDVTFLLAGTQGFEDTGVRAYKGQAAKLMGSSYLTPALQIHALEARHASRIRRLRRTLDTANTQVRYSGTVKGDAAAAAGAPTGASLPMAVVNAFAAIYAGEGNTMHTVNNGTSDATIDAQGLSGLSSGADVTLAFDEALGATAVAGIVQTFIIPDLPALSSNLQLSNPV